MAGWRVGYAAFPPPLQAQLDKVQDTHIITVPLVSQALALHLLQHARTAAHQHVRP